MDFPGLEAVWLGCVPYETADQAQRQMQQAVAAEESPNQLWLLEHPPVLTLPRRASKSHLLVDQETLQRAGGELIQTDRGGEVTLHNPGQLVGYLICRLDDYQHDLHHFLRWIETRLILLAERYGVTASQRKGYTGVWVENRKLASIGIAVNRWTTRHGFGLNINNDLSQFGWINPCGLDGVKMTSLSCEVGHCPNLMALRAEAAGLFGAVKYTPDGALDRLRMCYGL